MTNKRLIFGFVYLILMVLFSISVLGSTIFNVSNNYLANFDSRVYYCINSSCDDFDSGFGYANRTGIYHKYVFGLRTYDRNWALFSYLDENYVPNIQKIVSLANDASPGPHDTSITFNQDSNCTSEILSFSINKKYVELDENVTVITTVDSVHKRPPEIQFIPSGLWSNFTNRVDIFFDVDGTENTSEYLPLTAPSVRLQPAHNAARVFPKQSLAS